eukprot:TRINITY_DN2740_c0_g4_i2.p1 TRINITY_DN2740_c0_g4~~TRINITY_DN2740_c0_g4_i2.p1  ORF type:complete len:165 (-),score=41.85 TRINITY_DN2740_c0_g4_i2:847-1341(-)
MAGRRISAKEVLSKYVQTHAQAGLRGSKEGRGSRHDSEERDPLSGVTMKSRKEGYFYKRGEFFDSWQRRYFLLLKDKLNYYKTPPQVHIPLPLSLTTSLNLSVSVSLSSSQLVTFFSQLHSHTTFRFCWFACSIHKILFFLLSSPSSPSSSIFLLSFTSLLYLL